MKVRLLILLCFIINSSLVFGQTALNDVDTTSGFGKSLLGLYKKFDRLKFSGYLQPQYQFTDTAGAKGFAGGDFSPYSNNRFMLRRGRLRLDYTNYNDKGQPTVFFVFQFDGTERGFNARDFWGRVFENKYECFALSAGIMARPFGHELLMGSSDRETPERGRMSQILMKTERDLGAMVTFEPRRKDSKLRFFKWDLMLANGQGLTGVADFDSHKDLISRIYIKPQKVVGKITVAGGISALYGGMRQFAAKSYAMENGNWTLTDNANNVGKIAARQYYGADVQVKIPNKKGATEFRAEYIFGKQSASQSSSETSGAALTNADGTFAPLFTRQFNGAYFYYLQHLGSTKHQLLVKFDFYDPNTAVSKKEVNNSFSAADVKFSTLGIGYVYHVNNNLKAVFYYDVVKNEVTALKNYNRDLKDNVFTCRMQYRF